MSSNAGLMPSLAYETTAFTSLPTSLFGREHATSSTFAKIEIRSDTFIFYKWLKVQQ